MNNNVLTIIVPCYNEEAVLPETVKELTAILKGLIDDEKVAANSKILFVNDGSKDQTWSLISQYSKENELVTGLKFSRNYGHQNALLAGMSVAVKYSDMMITIDADLQDDVNAIPKMVEKYGEGYDVVYGVRNSRKTDTFFKRRTALAFYGLMRKMGVNLVPDSADYRLLSKRATESLLAFKERNLFLRGMVPLVGYRSTKVYYARKERFAGESKYPLSKMLHFALDGITSFSIAPIHLILYLGLLTVAVSIICMIYVIVEKCLGHVVSGWSSLMISIWLLGGIQLISISVIGEYIGKIFSEVKHRPRFTIEEENYTKKMKN
ncbi:MAG: glycosyltransferase family 2 protein [Limosilactobacillus oris]|jgi:glycosyltransferase involved in cell wall biosynthesis|uniref:glycosyltransferase family 2 protein n=1 Tax=Limosilactobacillus oris TaxID=1632 RepID=UPI00242E7F9C|nr:glycosyltransferase family 2 protein [Limosilactobacillus oris]MCH3910238.1 glycosyltransferase family 2 protein [Limosilactobacillus oris]MCH3939365.1 glycosyltransferase family 2 protein [Limosilactobacillus oris]MCI1980705.1 glycosyltransferase family 2 protein [Limosilactobacillus oris]MCI2043099.1 glycosyltransferase family 2 protein [Limosilactobacillus oris]